MKAALYARVSTVDKQDPEMQMRALREYCRARGIDIAGEYVDRISGVKDRRGSLDRLMDAAKKRQIDMIAVWKLDRWGRSLKHLVTSLDELNSLGIIFVSFQENIDLSTPSGRLMFHVIAAMAEFERELIRERVIAGVANARSKGKRIGRKGLAPIDIKRILDVYMDDTSRSVRTVAMIGKTSPATAARIISDYKAGRVDCDGFRIGNASR